MRLGVLLMLLAPVAAAAEEVALQALITDEALGEISGMAVSRRHDGIFWVHNDGDNAAELHAVDRGGERRATLHLAGVDNVDWEDLASFRWQDRNWLLVADVGDNGGLRRELTLLAVEEPAVLADAEVAVAWRQRFRWPDGARDCEAMAVDPHEAMVYLVSKKRVPPELFRLPLGPRPNDAVQVAQRIGTLAGIEQPTRGDLDRNPVYGRYRSQITAADISADGQLFAVLNYRRVYLWLKRGSEWSRSLDEPPEAFEFPWVPQAEALGFSPAGDALWLSSERLPAPLLRIPVRRR